MTKGRRLPEWRLLTNRIGLQSRAKVALAPLK